MSLRTNRHTSRAIGVSIGVGLALSMLATTASGADDAPQDAAWCDSIDVGAINALGPLQFIASDFPSPTVCFLVPASDTDAYGLSMAISGIDFDLMRDSSPDITELTIGDRAAVLADGYLHVDLGEGILTVVLELGDPGAFPDVDVDGFTTSVAEIAVSSLPPATSDGDAPTDAAFAPLPDIEGLEWPRNQEANSAQQLMEADEQQGAIWQPLLDALSAEPSELFILSLNPRDAGSGDSIGNYSAIRVAGTDEAAFRPAIIDWMRMATGSDDVATEGVTLGGKDVTRLSVDGEFRGYIYASGDTVHAVTMSDDWAARVFEALP